MNNALPERLAPFLAFVVAVLAGVNAIDPSPVGVFYDDAQYVILGRSIAEGHGYRYLNIPGAPSATHFPPGYPAFLALLWLMSPEFPGNIALFKMANVLLLGVVAIGTFVAARRLANLPWSLALVTAVAATATIPALVLSSGVMSETLFLALLVPLLVAAERGVTVVGVRRAAALGALAGLLCLVRTHAIALVVALALMYAWHRHRREALVAAAAAVLILAPWLLWVQHFDALIPAPLRGQYGSYGLWLSDGLRDGGAAILLAAIRDNVATTWAVIARSFSVARNPVLDAIAVVAVVTLLGLGAYALRARARLTILFLAIYFVLVLAWPFSPLRFIWGVWPLLMLLLVAGAHFLWNASLPVGSALLARTARVVPVCVVVLGALVFNVLGYANGWWATVSRSVTPRIQPQLAWVAENTNAGDVIVADDEGAVFLYTGRQALPANGFTVDQYFRPRPADQNARFMREIVQSLGATHVVAWTVPTREAADILVAARPPVLMEIDTIPTGKVYRAAGR